VKIADKGQATIRNSTIQPVKTIGVDSMHQIEAYLKATPTIDCETRSIKEKAQSLTEGRTEVIEKAKCLFYFVRDEIRYDPYSPLFPLQASATLTKGSGFCTQKAALLAALARAVRVPSRLGFADIRNYIMPERMAKLLGTDLIVYHGYAELYIGAKWVKTTPTFDLKMCQENRIIPVEFDGKNHGVFHSHNLDGKLHIEYVRQHGHSEDVPLDDILEAVIRAYGPEWAESWKTGFVGYEGR
jgi:transglutaminase-like putative cysteine protease